jgi:hypothetical protein
MAGKGMTDEDRIAAIAAQAMRETADFNKKHGTTWRVGRNGGQAIDEKGKIIKGVSKYDRPAPGAKPATAAKPAAFKKGGAVKKTGKALVHKGEVVLTKGQQKKVGPARVKAAIKRK